MKHAFVAAIALAAVAVVPVAQAAGSLGDYRLLILDGQRAKWGPVVAGGAVTLTYAVTGRSLHTPGAINCADMAPLDALLAASAVARSDFDRQLAAAFAAWSAVANIDFVRTDDVADADIVVAAEATPAGRAFTNVAIRQDSLPVAQRASAGGQGTIARSLICLNPDERWKIGFDGNLDVYDLRYALMHEIGHAIGLDHPDTPNAVMDFHYTERFATLQAGDIAGAVALYGPRQPIATLAVAAPAGPPPATAASKIAAPR